MNRRSVVERDDSKVTIAELRNSAPKSIAVGILPLDPNRIFNYGDAPFPTQVGSLPENFGLEALGEEVAGHRHKVPLTSLATSRGPRPRGRRNWAMVRGRSARVTVVDVLPGARFEDGGTCSPWILDRVWRACVRVRRLGSSSDVDGFRVETRRWLLIEPIAPLSHRYKRELVASPPVHEREPATRRPPPQRQTPSHRDSLFASSSSERALRAAALVAL